MLLQTLRTKFRAGANDLDANLDDAEVDAYLNRHYRFVVASDLGGDWAKTLYTLDTVAGQSSYTITSPGSGNTVEQMIAMGNELTAYIRDGSELYLIAVDTDPQRFEIALAGDPATTGRPTAMLAYARSLTFWPTPDDVYTITIPSRGGFEQNIDDASSISRLGDDRLAMYVLYSALMEYHHETQDEVSYARAEREFRRWRRLMLKTARGRAGRRFQARSF